ncbi:hypothetical protein Desor_3834 [Desulfosporosinus orientis DSM 765]|uniref:Uncharacterized protein n=1 Tax=Desulfosporosinus orientis (strain ATCC 19365 / DSM 765 / NCIMB 8382 / VKM B-1628 / Singapore I) TaxID=768706 RepID=G7W9F5_DESOD|nr:hypothetical protein [Desulfosporosinus orientis]AET69292.1 hypothetical protein Desor_3834 [Desulfosporosinus orientis DSM 765]
MAEEVKSNNDKMGSKDYIVVFLVILVSILIVISMYQSLTVY